MPLTRSNSFCAVSEFEKAMLVEKLKGARERKRRETGRKVGGRQNYAEMEGGPEVIALAKKLHRYPVNGRRRSLREVSAALAEAGYLSSAGTPYSASAVSCLLSSTAAAAPPLRTMSWLRPSGSWPNWGRKFERADLSRTDRAGWRSAGPGDPLPAQAARGAVLQPQLCQPRPAGLPDAMGGDALAAGQCRDGAPKS